MAHTPHELSEEFPDHADQLHKLKTDDAHFAKLAEEYHEVNREVHRVETNVEPASDQRIVELRKRRMILKDEISAMLSAAE